MPARAVPNWTDRALQVYLLGSVEFETALAWQRRQLFQVSGDRRSAALLVCEHPPLITIGRHGSWSHLAFDPGEQRLAVRWVNRGGGCFLHGPGQLAIYPVLPVEEMGLGLDEHLVLLHSVLISLLEDFSIRGECRPGVPGIWVGPRKIAEIGIGLRDGITYYGAVLNVNPDVHDFHWLRSGMKHFLTSVERERRGPLRAAMVRERLVEHFARRFGFPKISLFFDDPSLPRKAPSDAVPASS
jgi:lipoyl(octanoyl) transferase